MKTSMKKVLSLALAGALALTSVFSVNAVDASNAKKAAAVKTAKLSIVAAKDKAVNASTTVTGVAVSTKGASMTQSLLQALLLHLQLLYPAMQSR